VLIILWQYPKRRLQDRKRAAKKAAKAQAQVDAAKVVCFAVPDGLAFKMSFYYIIIWVPVDIVSAG